MQPRRKEEKGVSSPIGSAYVTLRRSIIGEDSYLLDLGGFVGRPWPMAMIMVKRVDCRVGENSDSGVA